VVGLALSFAMHAFGVKGIMNDAVYETSLLGQCGHVPCCLFITLRLAWMEVGLIGEHEGILLHAYAEDILTSGRRLAPVDQS
jgi:hypothetical protein